MKNCAFNAFSGGTCAEPGKYRHQQECDPPGVLANEPGLHEFCAIVAPSDANLNDGSTVLLGIRGLVLGRHFDGLQLAGK